jgi:hypothetical protein
MSESNTIEFKKGDRVTHKKLGAATVESIPHTPFGPSPIEGYELLNIRPDVPFSDNHAPTQLVFADACKPLK